MKSILSCSKCGANISDTAIKCPICLKTTGEIAALKEKINVAESAALAVAASASLVLSTVGAVSGGVLAVFLDVFEKKGIKKMAIKHEAIDSFILEDSPVLVTKDKFILLAVVASNIFDTFQVQRNELYTAFIDEKNSKKGGLFSADKTMLVFEYYDNNTKKREPAEYVFKGKDSRSLAEYACIKFLEYKT